MSVIYVVKFGRVAQIYRICQNACSTDRQPQCWDEQRVRLTPAFKGGVFVSRLI